MCDCKSKLCPLLVKRQAEQRYSRSVSVSWSVGRSVGRSVGLSVSQSVNRENFALNSVATYQRCLWLFWTQLWACLYLPTRPIDTMNVLWDWFRFGGILLTREAQAFPVYSYYDILYTLTWIGLGAFSSNCCHITFTDVRAGSNALLSCDFTWQNKKYIYKQTYSVFTSCILRV